MELESIYALMERFERSSISGLELEQNGTRLKLEKAVAVATAPVAAAAPVAAPAPAAAPVAGQPAQAEEGEYIKAPLVGTFYTAAGPDAAPFVQVGDKVQKGQTVCILEAMKAMSEIPAPMDCVIEEVLLDNGSLAAFDAPLFRVRRV
ncbi:acetyl-CoA carboxylase biotin carboxyl carrier protein [Flintibacter sp.]|uniref:acetyl-CoA carboxylase biotin carboxyl carrier protein n=1 Tax=Flintibacter sp. TaxID=1918624 RepID=UPI003D0ABB4A|nr:acetyl-CoA carboxylase biotin carboxyl carrier protein [Flintibacter sp.]